MKTIYSTIVAVLLSSNLIWAQGQPVTFSAFGDVPYGRSEMAKVQEYVEKHNLYSPSVFLMHVGDIISGSESCTEDKYSDLAFELKKSFVPTFIIPGDNEYNCCSNINQAWGYWNEHLSRLEENYCGLWHVERQSARDENFAFIHSGVLFIGISLPAGATDSDANNRMDDDADWIEAQFNAKKSQVRAAVVFGHSGPNAKRDRFFDRFIPAGQSFGKPLLYIMGDGHQWKFDNPFGPSNMRRIQVDNGGAEEPVQVTVGMSGNAGSIFQITRDPWSGNPSYHNWPPCVSAGPDLDIETSEAANLQGSAEDDGVPISPGKITYTWSKANGPGTVSFNTPNKAATTATFSLPGTYVVRLTADDGGISAYDEATVNVDAGTPVLAINDVQINEGTGGTTNAVFTVTLVAGTGQTVTVNYATQNGTALSGQDYTAVSGTLTFSGSTTSRTITVPIIGDNNDEPDEAFTVNLSNPTNASVVDGAGECTIIDDDLPPPPVISAFNPASGYAGLSVTITGSGFSNASAVKFGGITAAGFTIANDTQLDAVVPNSAASGPISITNQGGTGTSSINFTVTPPPAPTLASFSPTSGTAGSQVTIYGSYFTTATTVAFDGVSTTNFSVQSDGEITVQVPQGASTGKISVTNAGGIAYSTSEFTMNTPPLSLSPIADTFVASANPNTNEGGASALEVKNSGSSVMQTYLKFNVSGLSGGVQNAILRLHVTNSSDEGGAIYLVSNNILGTNTPWGEFDLIWGNAPALETAPLSSVGAVMDGQWAEFDVTAALAGDGIYSFGIASNNSDRVKYSSKEGSYLPELVITQGGASSSPAIAAFSPTSGSPGTEVTITGSNLNSANAVSFNGAVAASYVVDSNFQIRAVVSATATTGPIAITTPDGTAISQFSFTVIIPQPPAPPSALAATMVDTSHIDLSWSDNSNNENGCKIERQTGSDPFSEIAQVGAGITFFNDSGLTPNTPYSYRVRAFNGVGHSDYSNTAGATTAKVSVPPLANNDVASTAEDIAVSIEVLVNDSDSDGTLQPTTVTIVTSPAQGNITNIDQTTGAVTYVPNADYFGSDSFTYTVQDNDATTSNTATVLVTITPVNDGPVAAGESISLMQGTTTVIDILANESDVDGTIDPTSVAIVLQPAHGSILAIDPATGAINYQASASFNGIDSLCYTVQDDQAEVSNIATTIITIEPPPPPVNTFMPVADAHIRSSSTSNNYGGDDQLRIKTASTSYRIYLKFDVSSLSGSVESATLRLFVNEANPDGGSVYKVSNDYDGTTTPWTESGLTWGNAPPASGNPLGQVTNMATGQWIEVDVTAAVTGNGSYSFAMVSTSSNSGYYSSKEGSHAPELVVVIGGPPNAPPVALDDAITINEDSPAVVALLANDSDSDGVLDPSTITIVTPPVNGSITNIDGSSGTATYLPSTNFSGNDSFVYTVKDNRGDISNQASVTITVNAVNDAPVALADSATTFAGNSVSLAVLDNDSDVDGTLDVATVAIGASPVNGTINGIDGATGAITYSPNAGFLGDDNFTYSVKDNLGATSNLALVKISVTEYNDAPVAVNDTTTTPEDLALLIAVLDNDSDPDGTLQPASVSVVTAPSQGSITNIDQTTGAITYVPNDNYSGADSFTYTVADNDDATSNAATVLVSVTAVNDGPLANGESISLMQGTTAAIDILANDSDVDGTLDPASVAIVLQPAHGAILAIDPATGAINYQASANFSGIDSLCYTVQDDLGEVSNIATTIISIIPLPPPIKTFTPIADAHVKSSSPSDNYGSDDQLRIKTASTTYHVYFKFEVSGTTGNVQKATLRLFVNEANKDGGSVYSVSNDYNGNATAWTEAGITWGNAPTISGSPLGQVNNMVTGEWVEIEVTAAIIGDGIYSFGMTSNSSSSGYYCAKEGNNSPELVVESGAGGPTNIPPSAINDDATTDEDTPVIVAVPANDIDSDGSVDAASVSIVTPPANGSITDVNAITGAVTYEPATDYHGTDSFVYTIKDNAGALSNAATVTIIITSVLDAPNDLTATTIDTARIELSWADNANDEAGFKIERQGDGSPFTEIAQVGPNVATYLDTDLAAGTTYTYRVRAYNSGSESDYSEAASAATETPASAGPQPPVAPGALAVTVVDTSHLDLSWTDNSNDESGFKIERQNGSNPFAEIAQVGAGLTTYHDSGLTPNTTYAYRLRAFNGNGDSNYSNTASALTDTVPLPQPPAAPSALLATTIDTSRIDLSWEDHADNEDGFKIERQRGSDPFAEIALVSANATAFNDADLTPATNYAYRVRAFNGNGDSDYSYVANATTDTIPLPPAVIAFTPASGYDGLTVVITGSSFGNATAVAFGGTAAESFTIVSDTQIDAVVPSGATTGSISVTSPVGTGASSVAFTITLPPAPTIAGFTPASGNVGTQVMITGNNLTAASAIAFNGVAASNFTEVSDNEIAAVVPPGASTGKITVTTAGGSTNSNDDFIVTALPISLNPIADTYVESADPSANNGTSGIMAVKNSGSSVMNAYLKFNVTGISGSVLSAKLLLHVLNSGDDGGSIYSVANDLPGTNTPWEESNVTWNTAPAISGTPLSTLSAVSDGDWVEFDVTSAIVGDGIYSFGIANNSSDRVKYHSNNDNDPPVLVITHGGPTPLAKTGSDDAIVVEAESAPEITSAIPDALMLFQNYPNPFNPTTRISFAVPQDTHVRLSVRDVTGRTIAVLVNGNQPRGVYHAEFDASSLPSGLYFSVLEVSGETRVRRMILMK